MPAIQFDAQSMAQWYAEEHRKTDPGVVAVYYLPKNGGEREIRLVEVNNLIGERNDRSLEPVDFGVDRGMDTEHTLVILDVTPDQWKRIKAGELSLPGDWSLDGTVAL